MLTQSRVPSPEASLVDASAEQVHLPQEAKIQSSPPKKCSFFSIILVTVVLTILGLGGYHIYSLTQKEGIVSPINNTKDGIIQHADSSSGSGSSSNNAQEKGQSKGNSRPKSYPAGKNVISSRPPDGDDPNRDDEDDDEEKRKKNWQNNLMVVDSTKNEDESDESDESEIEECSSDE